MAMFKLFKKERASSKDSCCDVKILPVTEGYPSDKVKVDGQDSSRSMRGEEGSKEVTKSCTSCCCVG